MLTTPPCNNYIWKKDMGTTIVLGLGFLLAIFALFIKRIFRPTPFTQEAPPRYGVGDQVTQTWREWKMEKDRHDKDAKQYAQLRFAITGAAWALIGVATLGLFISSFTVIQGNEVGVPITFGKVGAELKPGPHFVAPWTSVETYPTRPLPVNNQDAVARSSQNGQFSLSLGARWHTGDAKELWYQARSGDENKVSNTIVDPLLAQAARNVFSVITNTQGIQDAVGNETKIKAELQRLVDKYGIVVDDVYIRSSEPDQHTSDVIAQLTAQQQQTAIATAALATAQQQNAVVKQQAQNAKDAAQTLPTDLNPQQLLLYCAKIWADTQAQAIAKGVTLYTSPCSATSNPNLLVGAK